MENLQNCDIVGKAFEELSFEEMVQSQGSGEVEARTTIICFLGTLNASGIATRAICN